LWLTRGSGTVRVRAAGYGSFTAVYCGIRCNFRGDRAKDSEQGPIRVRRSGRWTLLFPEAHPHAGGPDHYAAYLVNTDGFEVELVADLKRI
jgi:hypothetical protein